MFTIRHSTEDAIKLDCKNRLLSYRIAELVPKISRLKQYRFGTNEIPVQFPWLQHIPFDVFTMDSSITQTFWLHKIQILIVK